MGAINTLLLLYAIYRLHLIGNQPRTPIRVSAPSNATEWNKPVENFDPKKPETLRPNQVRGREVEEREFEFDVKIKK